MKALFIILDNLSSGYVTVQSVGQGDGV